MDFNEYGLIAPPAKIVLTRDEFERVFVNEFPSSQTRKSIYADYKRFTDEFSLQITDRFIQWIGGSFTTQKINPRDIDVLTILNRTAYQERKAVIENLFRRKSNGFPFVDSYFLQVPATDDSEKTFFKSDLIYWVHQFSYTRKGRNGRRSSRGYIELNFNNFSYEK